MGLFLPWRTGNSRLMIAGARRYVLEHGHLELVLSREGNPYLGESDMLEAKMDGMVAILGGRDIYARARERAVCIVLLEEGPRLPAGARVAFVLNDDYQTGRMAAQHLLDKGFLNFAFFSFDPSMHVQERKRGFAQRLNESGLSFTTIGDIPFHSRPQAERRALLERALLELPRPCGIFSARDYRAIEVMEACRRIGLGIPEEIALVGGENETNLQELYGSFLSAVAINAARIGWEGAAALDRMLQGRKRPRTPLRIPPVRVVARRSTQLWAVQDPLVRRALLLIEKRACRPFVIRDFARELGCSESLLRKRFRSALGRSPYAEVLRQRLERAKELLLNPRWTMREVAEAVGFREQRELTGLFRNRLGLTPSAFRDRARARPRVLPAVRET
ncbi:MAG: substrate-binding domain-containing protein [Kiritimatiellae bacterium]|nr:substrate-binding domain-containing protein [Kiritimatiellia bacterium]